MNIPVLTVAGLWNSGPQHWQTQWEAKDPSWLRVAQRDWDHPVRDEWVEALDAAVRSCPSAPVLVAHSLGCALVAQWVADRGGRGVRGAFLVAPSDVEAHDYPVEGRSFSSMPLIPLPFPSVVITSSNDPYVSVTRARQFAEAWQSRLIDIGPAGHINGASGHGLWLEGQTLFEEFTGSLDPGARA